MKMKKCKECNEPGVELNQMKGGIDKKMNNLISFDDFEKTFKPEEQKKTKRTEVGLDIVKEGKDYLRDAASKYAKKNANASSLQAFLAGAKWMKFKNWEDTEKK